MPQPVRNQYERSLQHAVVTYRLGEHPLVERDVRSFAFRDQTDPAVPTGHRHIGPLPRTRELHRTFLRYACRKRSLLLHQKTNQVLPHPLLGSQHEPPFADAVPYLRRRGIHPEPENVTGKIKLKKSFHLSIKIRTLYSIFSKKSRPAHIFRLTNINKDFSEHRNHLNKHLRYGKQC